MRNYTVSPEFKTQVSTILSTKKFSTVFPHMNLVNREGFTYSEVELNSIVQFLGEFAYNEVAEFFTVLPTLVKEEGAANEQSNTNVATTEAVAETSEVSEEI
jgi:hypothetical protein